MSSLRTHAPLWLLLGLTALGHLPLMTVPPLSSDEGLYWEWSRHLALGYYSHPPLVGWLIAAMTGLLGTSLLSVRLTALALHLGTVALLYAMARELTREVRLPLLAGVLYVLMPTSLILGSLIVTDGPLVLCWTAAAWFTKRAVIDGQRRFWYAAGVAAGGMLLSKFFAALFFPGLLAFLLAHPVYRRELARKEPWLAALLALAVFMPFLYWNATHQWLTLQFNLVNRQGATHLGLLTPLLYVAGQLIAMSPVVPLALVAALVAVGVTARRRLRPARAGWAVPDDAQRRAADALLYYAVLTAVPLLIFAGVSFTARVGSHWTASVLPTAALVTAAWLLGLPAAGGRATPEATRPALRRPRWAWACVIGLALTLVPIYVIALRPSVLPERFYTYDLEHERAPPVSKYFGWAQAGREIARLRAVYQRLPGGLFLSTRDYSDAALFDFYTPGGADFVLMGYRAQEFHGKEFLMWARDIKRPGANTLFVMDEPIFPGNAARIAPYFRHVEPLDTLIVHDAEGRILRKFYFALGVDYLANEPDVLSRW